MHTQGERSFAQTHETSNSESEASHLGACRQGLLRRAELRGPVTLGLLGTKVASATGPPAGLAPLAPVERVGGEIRPLGHVLPVISEELVHLLSPIKSRCGAAAASCTTESPQ